MSRRKKRFKIRYVVLPILAVLVIAIAAVIGTHWDLIKAAKMGLTADPETILADQQKKDQEIRESLGIEGLITDEMIAQAQEEVEQSWSGEETGLSGESLEAGQETQSGEAGQAQTSSQNQQSSSAQNQQGSSSGNSGSGSSTGAGGSSSGGSQTEADIIAKYTAKLYGVRGAYQGRSEGIISSAKSEFAALPAEQQTNSAKSSILSSKLSQAEGIESECDAKVESVLGEMSAELSAAGHSTDSVGQLRNYYEDTKANQKAAYLAMARGS